MANSPQSAETQAIKDARPELNGQEFRPLVYQGEEIPQYTISKDGLVMSYKVYKEGKLLSWTSVGNKGSKYPAVKLSLPVNKLSYVDELAGNFRGQTIGRTIKIHILVADAWLGTAKCPEDLEPWWDDFPLELKKLMRPYFHIDHVDDNKLNAHVDNLKFVSPRDNQFIRKAGSDTRTKNNT